MAKHVLPGGATRSEKAPPYHLVPWSGLRRTALRFELGAENHGEFNWIRSLENEASAAAFANEAYNHMLEHVRKMAMGIDPEDDHLGAIGWAQSVLCYIEEKFGYPWTHLNSPKIDVTASDGGPDTLVLRSTPWTRRK